MTDVQTVTIGLSVVLHLWKITEFISEYLFACVGECFGTGWEVTTCSCNTATIIVPQWSAGALSEYLALHGYETWKSVVFWCQRGGLTASQLPFHAAFFFKISKLFLSLSTGAGSLWQRRQCTDRVQTAKEGCRCLAAASSLHLPPWPQHLLNTTL